ncbi:MAG: hypothetical protein JST54_29095 [Deltaproteobacteria bacterium]|nr:hypothetical protein [Deltaproteobacteria bacterium]
MYAPYRGVQWSQDWREEKRGELPGQVESICGTIEQEVPHITELVQAAENARHELERKHEAEMLEWKRQQDEERRAKALKESRDELQLIMDAWSRARHIEEFFERARKDIEARAGEEKAVLLEKLERARGIFGTPDPIQKLRAWRLPEER